ncbi:MAG: BamA/TamA family outer membrane protein, partial [Bdellovibrionota bacterium]
GAEFFAYLEKNYGKEKIAAWVDDYALGPIPDWVDGSAREVFGKPFHRLWEEWQQEVEQEAARQAERLCAEGLREGEILLVGEGWIEAPRFTPEGKIAFGWLGPDLPSGLYELDPSSGETEKLPFRATELRFSPDGKTVYGGKSWSPDSFSIVDQIHSGKWPPEGNLEPIKGAAHGREAALSPDGKSLVFVRRNGTATYLAKLDLERPEAEAAPLTDPKEKLDYAHPLFLPDGQTLVASVLENDRWRLWRIELSGKRVAPVISPDLGGQEIHPALSSDGRFLAYASDRTGIYNVFVRDLSTGAEAQTTNILGAALEPTFTPDGKEIVFVSWEADGHVMRKIGAPGLEIPIATPQEPALSPGPSPNFGGGVPSAGENKERRGEGPELEEEGTQPPAPWDFHPYNPMMTLLPRFWMPNIALDNNDTLLGAWTASEDLLRHWFYSLSAYYGFTSEEPRAFATLGYSRLALKALDNPLVFASYGYTLASFGQGELPGGQIADLFERRHIAQIGFSTSTSLEIGVLPITGEPLDGFHYSAGYQFEAREANAALQAASTLTKGNLSGFFGSLEYNKVRTSLRAISHERGARVLFEANSYHEELGGDFSGAVLSGDGRAFLPIPRLPHHVLALRVAGGTTVGDRPSTRAFVLGGSLGEGLVNLSSTRLSLLRGYPDAQFGGDHFLSANAEYRLPLWRPRRGWRNFPAFLKTLHLVGFADAGVTWDKRDGVDAFDEDNVAIGVGGELVATGTIGFYIPLSVRLGVGRSLGTVEQLDVTTTQRARRIDVNPIPPSIQAYIQIGRSF